MFSQSQKSYVWRCKACNSEVTTDGRCTKHGMVNARFVTEQGACYSDYHTACPDCGEILAQVHLPVFCTCGSESLEWHGSDGQWYQPDLSVDPALADTDHWIRGDFEGLFFGPKSGSSDEMLGRLHGVSPRAFEMALQNGKLANVVIVDGPPGSLADDERRPLRQHEVAPVRVAQVKGGGFLEVSLVDFRLHHWEAALIKERTHDARVQGQVTGVAYGRMRRYERKILTGDVGRNTYVAPEDARDSNCAVCNVVLQALLALFAAWRCAWPTGLLDFGLMRLMCGLQSFARRWPAKSLNDRERIRRDWGLVLMSMLGLVMFFWLGWCGRNNPWWLLLPAVTMFGGAWVRSCAIKALLIFLFQIGLWFSCRPGVCPPGGGNLLNQINEGVQHLVQEVLHQTPLQQAQEAAQNNGQPLPLSIDQALAHPELLDDCKRPVRLEAKLLFDFDKSELLPSTESDLRKLLQLMQNERFRGRSYVITGHADKKGDGTDEGRLHNQKLSADRARRVAEWLQSHGQFAPSQLRAHGESSWNPVSLLPRMDYLNRRVEVQSICLPPATGGGAS